MTIARSKAGSASGGFDWPPNGCRASGSGASPYICLADFPSGYKDLDTAKAEFKAAWEALKAQTPPEQLAAAYRAMNIRATADLSGLPHYLRMRRAMLSECSESCSRHFTSLATEWRDRFGWSFQMASASFCHRRHCAARARRPGRSCWLASVRWVGVPIGNLIRLAREAESRNASVL